MTMPPNQVPPGGGYSQQPPANPGVAPDNYLVWSILSTVLCCLPLGIVAIIKSNEVNTKWAMGDYQGAYDSAESAKKFAIWGAAVAGVLIVLYIVFLLIMTAVAGASV